MSISLFFPIKLIVLLEKTLSDKISSVNGKTLWGGIQIFNTNGGEFGEGEWKIPVLGRGDQTPMHTM